MLDVPHIIRATDPRGTVFYIPDCGEPLADRARAFVYSSSRAAANGARYWYGTNDVFWNSERASAAGMARGYRGWRFDAEPLAEYGR